MDPRDHHSQELTDDALAGEIALLGELMAAAAITPRRLTGAEIDDALGLRDHADDVRERLGAQAVIERATGYVAETRGVDMAQARGVLREAAAEAGIEEVDAARAVLEGLLPAVLAVATTRVRRNCPPSPTGARPDSARERER